MWSCLVVMFFCCHASWKNSWMPRNCFLKATCSVASRPKKIQWTGGNRGSHTPHKQIPWKSKGHWMNGLSETESSAVRPPVLHVFLFSWFPFFSGNLFIFLGNLKFKPGHAPKTKNQRILRNVFCQEFSLQALFYMLFLVFLELFLFLAPEAFIGY